MSKLQFIKELLFIDGHTGKPSLAKGWANVGYAVFIAAFWFVVTHGISTDPIIWMVFSAAVMGNHTFQKVINMKYGTPKAEQPPESK